MGALTSSDTSPVDGATLEALAELYKAGYHTYLRVAEAIVGNVETAHDAVQDAFARAVRSRSGYRGTGSLEGWMWRTVVNAAKTARRDSPPVHVPLDEVGVGAPGPGDNSAGELRKVVASLPERQRLVLFLRHYADLDYGQIAETLEITVGTVGATLNQAHSSLRRHLEEVPA